MPLKLADAIESSRDAAARETGSEKDYLWTLNFGPQHPATHTTLRLILTLDGETVIKAIPDIGYLHSGFEKLGEHLDFNQYVTIVDRMNYVSPVANEISWHHAVEKLLSIELTPRAKYLRTIFAELMRIHDHLLCAGAAALDLGGLTAFLYAFNEKEKIYDLCERAAGQRFHPGYTRVGGLLKDVDDVFLKMARDLVKTLPSALDDVERLLNRNRIFIERTKGIGVLTKEEAINRSATGPIARASGVVRDLRKDEPYLAYGELSGSFKVVCSKEGDCLARYLVRMQEMRESVKIIHAAIENLPTGPINVDVEDKEVLPNQMSVYRSIEGLIQHFELIMTNRKWKAPVDEVYGATETANGELGYYIVSDGSGVAYRARTRPPSFIHFALFPHMIEGHQISDVVAVLGSINIIAAELDR
jgi:NADH-quinone oxidoreductase subunit D